MKYFSRNEKIAANFRENPSPPEQRLIECLSDGIEGYHFKFQVPVLDWIIDFYSPELNFGIEVDGNWHKHTTNRRRDQERDQLLWENAGVLILRIAARAILEDIEGVQERIKSVIKNVEQLDRDSPLLRYKAKTTRVIKYTPEEKKELIRKLEARGRTEKIRYSPC